MEYIFCGIFKINHKTQIHILILFRAEASVTHLAAVDEAKRQRRHFSSKDQQDDHKELEEKRKEVMLNFDPKTK